MKNAVIRAMILGLMSAMTYLGFLAGVDGDRYVMQFFVWAICLPLGLIFAFSDEVQKKTAIEPARGAMTALAGRLVAWGCLGVMIWTGHIATAVAFGIHMLCCAVAREREKRYRVAPT